jgi:hypothetical protein
VARQKVGRKRQGPPKGARRKRNFGKRSDSKWHESFSKVVRLLIKAENLSDAEISEFLGVNNETLLHWKRDNPEFARAFLRGEKDRKKAMERSLFNRGVGMTIPASKIFQHRGKIIEHAYQEFLPPETAAMKLWLAGNMPEKYGDKLELGGSLPVKFVIKGLEDDRPALIENAGSEAVDGKAEARLLPAPNP